MADSGRGRGAPEEDDGPPGFQLPGWNGRGAQGGGVEQWVLQMMTMQNQLLQNLTQVLANMQQAPPPPPQPTPAPRSKLRDFQGTQPPVFTSPVEPMHYVPAGEIKMKRKEFLSLKQGSMTVREYLTKFTHLSRYAPEDVNTDEKKQDCFVDGLDIELKYSLSSNYYPSFQKMVDKAFVMEKQMPELEAHRKRKMSSQDQSSWSSTRPRFVPQSEGQPTRPVYRTLTSQTQQQRQQVQQPQPRLAGQTKQSQQQGNKNSESSMIGSCYTCGEIGHLSNRCQKKKHPQ